MTPRRAAMLVARREIRVRLRSREFVISTAVQIVIVIAIVAIAGIISGDDETYDVGTVGPQAEAIADSATAQQAQFSAELSLTEFEDEAAARAAVEDDEVDAVIGEGELITSSATPTELVALLQGGGRRARGAEVLRSEGVSATQIDAALDAPPLRVDEVGSASEGEEGIAFVGVLLLYVGILGFGMYVATGVTEEKSSRVVEVVLATIRPGQLLAGKVAGIGLLGVMQVLVIAAAGLAAGLLVGVIEVPASTAFGIVLVFVYFLLGYALYACAFAVAGTLVSRQEDTQSSTSPLILVLVVAYVVSISIEPNSGTAQVFTFLPPLAPLIVPARAVQDVLPAWELALSLLLMLVAIALMLNLARRIYERTVLRMGAPIKLAEALRLRAR